MVTVFVVTTYLGYNVLFFLQSLEVRYNEVLLYNAETWTLKEEHRWKLSLFEMSVLRRICGITRRDRRRNVDTKQDLDINVDIVERLQRHRLTHFGHVQGSYTRVRSKKKPSGFFRVHQPKKHPPKSHTSTLT